MSSIFKKISTKNFGPHCMCRNTFRPLSKVQTVTDSIYINLTQARKHYAKK